MSTSDKVKAALSCSGKKQMELAEYLGMKKQNLNTKMQRDSWPANDLARVAEFVGARVGFVFPNGTTIYFDQTDKEGDSDGH